MKQHSTHTTSLTARRDLPRWFRKVGGWDRETCRFIGHRDGFIICIDGIIPNHVTAKADKPMTEVKRFLKAGNRYWAAQPVGLSGSEISTCAGWAWRGAGGGGGLTPRVCETGQCKAAAWHGAMCYKHLVLQWVIAAEEGLCKSHRTALFYRGEKPVTKS